MKHGRHIPKELRGDMARRALAIFEAAESRARALIEIEAEFDVSQPTARNLVSYGRFLRRNSLGNPARF